MIPTITALLEARDFLHRVATLPAKESQDLLFNHTEDLIARLNAGLGVDAFKEGDSVLVTPSETNLATESFVGHVTGKRLDTDGSTIFRVADQDGEAFDCEVSELQLEESA